MEKVMAFKIPKGADSPKGPDRALKEAVALLAPFDFTPKKRPGLDTSELLEADPEGIATAFVMNLAKHLNAFLYCARFGQRGRDVFAKMEKLRGMLVKLSREISSLDDWTRFHLQDDRGKLETKFLPPFGVSEAGSFEKLADQFAEHIENAMASFRAYYGGNEIVDQGGRQNHEERFLGSAKIRFICEAFELFDSYHPGSATSTEGAPFHTFVHRVYEYATSESDEDRAALSYLLRELITPLGKYQACENESWLIEGQLSEVRPNSIEYLRLRRRQSECDSEMRKLKVHFTPSLRRAVRVQPVPKKRK